MKLLRRTALAVATLSLVATTATASLGADEPGTDASPGPIGVFGIEDMPWLLTAQVVDGEMTPVPDGVVVGLLMEDGEAGGSGGCNTYFASYQLDGSALTFDRIGSTMMFCEGPAGDVESAYFMNLAQVAAYQSGGIQMALLDADGGILLEFDLAPPGSIVGDWVAQGVNNGSGGVVSSAMTPSITATFSEDGALTGNDGCNQYQTTYTTEGESITISPEVAMTRMACPDEGLAEQSAEYFAALAAATTWSVDIRGSLELRDDEGALQVRYQPAAG